MHRYQQSAVDGNLAHVLTSSRGTSVHVMPRSVETLQGRHRLCLPVQPTKELGADRRVDIAHDHDSNARSSGTLRQVLTLCDPIAPDVRPWLTSWSGSCQTAAGHVVANNARVNYRPSSFDHGPKLASTRSEAYASSRPERRGTIAYRTLDCSETLRTSGCGRSHDGSTRLASESPSPGRNRSRREKRQGAIVLQRVRSGRVEGPEVIASSTVGNRRRVHFETRPTF
jgi:hypothetical protein